MPTVPIRIGVKLDAEDSATFEIVSYRNKTANNKGKLASSSSDFGCDQRERETSRGSVLSASASMTPAEQLTVLNAKTMTTESEGSKGASVSKVATKMQSGYKQSSVHLPDFFFAHNNVMYSDYQYDCSKAYNDWNGFIRNSLHKHKRRGDFSREGKSDEIFKHTQQIKAPASTTIEERQKEHWRQIRYVLFGTPRDVPIPECVPKDHPCIKAKRSKEDDKGQSGVLRDINDPGEHSANVTAPEFNLHRQPLLWNTDLGEQAPLFENIHQFTNEYGAGFPLPSLPTDFHDGYVSLEQIQLFRQELARFNYMLSLGQLCPRHEFILLEIIQQITPLIESFVSAEHPATGCRCCMQKTLPVAQDRQDTSMGDWLHMVQDAP